MTVDLLAGLDGLGIPFVLAPVVRAERPTSAVDPVCGRTVAAKRCG